MNRPTKDAESALALDVLVSEDLVRRPCGSPQPANAAIEVPFQRKPTVRCDHAERELYRNHFPAER
ncbi:MAG: hypothetical protein M3552_10855 [Planctomycetota bacterium]|nr:hypothetical protein [Planctomycetaceae bacterium]MDQ3331137.1 hypothetical protein [Planctomycetota bacterium]